MCSGCKYLDVGKAHCYCQADPKEVELSPNHKACSRYESRTPSGSELSILITVCGSGTQQQGKGKNLLEALHDLGDVDADANLEFWAGKNIRLGDDDYVRCTKPLLDMGKFSLNMLVEAIQ